MVSQVQAEDRKNKSDKKIWHVLACEDGMDTARPDPPEILLVSNGSVNEKLLNHAICDFQDNRSLLYRRCRYPRQARIRLIV